MMEATLTSIVQKAKIEAKELSSKPAFEVFKASVMGPNGSVTEVIKSIGKLPKEEKPIVGRWVNEAKGVLNALFEETLIRIEKAAIQAKLGASVDPTLSSVDYQVGSRHPLSQVRTLISDVFRKIGFSVAEGPEVDTEWYCFDALNTPKNHPARAEQDTYYFCEEAAFGNINKHENERYLLRAHTSTVQIRTLLKGKPPIRVIAPGRAFRRDTPDATHSANFHQMEGLYVDENVTIKDLKAVLDYFVREVFGKDVKTRLRPSFFPFTEPSFEMDLNSPNLGKLSNQWIEVMGCGMVDPNVFKNVGYNPDIYRGYAFGMGIERIAMILHGIDDIRYFYQNDLRFLGQFA